MKRKVVLHGPSTLIVSLPRKWVKRRGIKKGDELEVVEDGPQLVFSTEQARQFKSVEVDISEMGRSPVLHLIRGLYRLGYDEIVLRYSKPETLSRRHKQDMSFLTIIHEEVNRLIGLEVVEERKNRCVLRDLGGTQKKDYEPILRRVFRLIINSVEDFFLAAQKRDNTLLLTIRERDDTITKFISYCMRMINKYSNTSSEKTLYLYNILANLDQIADVFKYAARDAVSITHKADPKTIEILDAVHKAIVQFYEYYYNYRIDTVEEIHDTWYRVWELIGKSQGKIPVEEGMLVTKVGRATDLLLVLTEGRMAIEY